MPRRFQTYQAAFTSGELSDQLAGRRDVGAYYVGCKQLANVLPSPQGPCALRPGTRGAGTLPGPARFATMVVNEQTRFAIVFTHLKIRAYLNASLQSEIASPFADGDLDTITWANAQGSLLIAQEAHPLQVYVNDPDFAIADYVFEAPPQQRYADRSTTLTPSGTSGAITVTSSAALFRPDSVGEIWEIGKKRWTITAYTDATHVNATTAQTLPGTTATVDWTQQAASGYGGYFRSVAFHEGRLWLGGTTRSGWRLWGSRVGQPYNFQTIVGTTVVDDDGVAVDASAGGRLDAVNHLISGSGGLEVFTVGHEGLVPSGANDPITPAKVKYRPQSRYGDRRYVRPTKLDSQTIFVQQSGGATREYVYSDVEQAYQSVPLTIRATHLVDNPVSMDSIAGGFGRQTDFLLVCNADGTGAIMASQRSEQVAAWADWYSVRKVLRVASMGSSVYIATVDVSGGWHLEILDETARFDSQFDATSGIAKTAWTGATDLAGRTVQLYADGYDRGDVTVDGGGGFTTAEPHFAVSVGYQIVPVVQPMPVDTPQQSISGKAVRPIKVTLRHVRSTGLRVNGKIIPDRPFLNAPNTPPTPTPEPYTQQIWLRGWRKDDVPPVVLTRDGSGPFEIISFGVDYAIGAG